MKHFGTGLVAALLGLAALAEQSRAQTPTPGKVDCKVAECAQLMVEISTKLISENDQLKKRLAAAQTDIDNLKRLVPTTKAELHGEIERLVAVKPATPNKTAANQLDETGRFGNEGTGVFPLRCEDGQVAIGVDLTLGGTCHTQCGSDGRPIQQFKVVCRALQIAK